MRASPTAPGGDARHVGATGRAGLFAMLLGALTATTAIAGDTPESVTLALSSIDARDIRQDLLALASAPLEGRDTPSLGLARAAGHIAGRLEAAGFVGAGPEGSFLSPFSHRVPAPIPESCSLAREGGGESYVYGRDFVPVWGGSGSGRGAVVFVGFGIDSPKERYDDLRGHDLKGRVAVVLQGEPRHKRKFGGQAVVTADADLYGKLARLETEGVAGVLMVRRPTPDGADGLTETDTPIAPLATLGFRHTWAAWAGEGATRVRFVNFPVLEITPRVAEVLLGIDVLDVADRIDREGKPPRRVTPGPIVSMASACEQRAVAAYNVVGILAGTDPDLADEVVVIGAHYDHVGVDARGRTGFGADDNGSGTAAVLEVAQALALSRPRRSILVCAFAAEEDALAGSRALCKQPPVPIEKMVAMINLDMVGRGETSEVVVIGLIQNPALDKVLRRAERLSRTGVKHIVKRQGQELFQRSDHYSFHVRRVPTLFFFEGLPLTRNPDYHTWRDTIDTVDVEKVTRTARLTFNTAWLLAMDEERPPRPEY